MRRASLALSLALALLAASTGPAAAASLTPSSASFGRQPVGTVGPPRAFVLTRDADPAFTVAVSVTGDFRQTSNCPPVLVMSVVDSCTVTVRFAPEKEGPRTGILAANTMLFGAPASALTGVGGDASAGLGNAGCRKGGNKRGKKRAASSKKRKGKGKGCKKKRGKKKGKRKR